MPSSPQPFKVQDLVRDKDDGLVYDVVIVEWVGNPDPGVSPYWYVVAERPGRMVHSNAAKFDLAGVDRDNEEKGEGQKLQ